MNAERDTHRWTSPPPAGAPSSYARSWLFASLLVALAALATCGGQQPEPRLLAIEPNTGFGDQETAVTITGLDLAPGVSIDPGTQVKTLDEGFTGEVGRGDVTVPLVDIEWLSTTRLHARVGAGLPAGTPYDVVVRDPRGRQAHLPAAYTSVGIDQRLPVIDVLEPRPPQERALAPSASFTAIFSAHDPAPGSLRSLTWQITADGTALDAGICTLAPDGGPTSCRFDATVPETLSAGSRLSLLIEAVDASARANKNTVVLAYDLRARPTLASVSPDDGAVAGGTDVLVKGTGFSPQTRILIGGRPLSPGGGVLIDEQTISGRTPPLGEPIRGARPSAVSLESPLGTASLERGFLYVQPPMITGISPGVALSRTPTIVSVRGEAFVPATRILFGQELADALPLEQAEWRSHQEIVGFVPRHPPGTARVWAVHPQFGSTVFREPFAWVDDP